LFALPNCHTIPSTSCLSFSGRREISRVVSRPSPYEVGPSLIDVYNASFEFYGHDRSVPDVDRWDLAQDLVRLGYLNSMPRLVDVEYAQELIREV
jgi:hypothetical protein